MKLQSFQVQQYKSIMDSGQVEVDPLVTCLVGKNESGKSAVMQALWKFNNAAGAKYDPLIDLPAELFIKLRNADPEVVVLGFALEDQDQRSFAEAFPEMANPPSALTIRSTFSGNHISVDVPEEVDDSHEEFPELLKLWALDRLPIFIYFDDYGRLGTRIHLPTYLRHLTEGATDRETQTLLRTQTALFQWAGLDPQELQRLGQSRQHNETQEEAERRKGVRSRLLESGSHTLSGDWMSWWDQREHQLEFSADGEDLELRVSDDLNSWKIPFGERSHGFQWFLSFYLTFLAESEQAPNGAILLLDEPGLHLHPSQQLKLLRFFRQISEKNQILYSTHSVFMVDPDHIDNVRTVYMQPKDPENAKSSAYTKVAPTGSPQGDPETIMPLQTAGAYHLAQTVTLGKRTLVVGELSHYWIIQSLVYYLRDHQDQTLHPETMVVWTGGTRNLLPMSNSMRNGNNGGMHHLAILMDEAIPGLKKDEHIVGLLKNGNNSVLSIGQLLNIKQAQLEDLLEPSELVEAMRRTGRNPTGIVTPQHEETNVPFLQRLFTENGWGELGHQDKTKIILKLTDSWRLGSPPPAKATLERAKKVFSAVNQSFE